GAAGHPLVEQDDPVSLGVEHPPLRRAHPRAWPAVQEDDRLALRVAAHLVVQLVPVAHRQVAGLVRLDLGVEGAQVRAVTTARVHGPEPTPVARCSGTGLQVPSGACAHLPRTGTRPCRCATAGGAGCSCRSSLSACGRTSATPRRWRPSGRSSTTPSTGGSPRSTWRTTTVHPRVQLRRTSAGCCGPTWPRCAMSW